ncbi:Atxe2 family lasso peptide isopeptidase [Erythrobacter sp.]|uniref:Atxe2 family lasso peptide isopeptidase n=1 Tax=Erythrobacter sp. TaxID=1042 RepID=UPI00311F9DB7
MIGPFVAIMLMQSVVPTASVATRHEDACLPFGRREPLRDGSSMSLADQVELADIGRASTTPAPSAFGISPDGGRVAILLKRANPRTNSYCQVLVVKSIDGTGKPVEVARGGEFIRDDFALRDFSAIAAGWERPNTPRWSPDGRSIAYLRQEDGRAQVWLVDPEARLPLRRATNLPDTPDAFAWTPDGRGLVVATRPGIRLAAEAIAREGLGGFHFDDRFSPQFADRPIPTGQQATAYRHVSLEDGSSRPATAEEAALVEPLRPSLLPRSARRFRAGPAGLAAWLEAKTPEYLLSSTRVVWSGATGPLTCETEECEGVRDLWWSQTGRSLYLLQTTGWARSQTALLRWDPGEPKPQAILLTEDILLGCTPLAEELICQREGTTQPRRLVAIDMRSGSERVIHDPNPGFRSLRLGKVQRLRFTNAYGVEDFADLVLPPDHRPGERHPLVVVQYRSRGFLRGGTGDEVPIYPLAARGLAVLSFERPAFLPEAYRATKESEMRSLNVDPWADRRQVQSSLERALALAVASGTVDPERMGISGLSDGSSTVQFALVNSKLFKAATMGSCCEDMYSFALAAGPRFTDELRAMRYRYFDENAAGFWEPMSLILNAARLDTPILIQASDSEYEGSLDVVEALSHRGKPIDLFVFPDEAHFKWQPAHREAMYRRNIEWFEFWLMQRKNCDPSKRDQYEVWQALPGAPAELQCFTEPSAAP